MVVLNKIYTKTGDAGETALGNGARVEQLNWLADPSEKGLAQSAGIMANYAYVPSRIERNHEAYVKRGAIAASAPVRALARPG